MRPSIFGANVVWRGLQLRKYRRKEDTKVSSSSSFKYHRILNNSVSVPSRYADEVEWWNQHAAIVYTNKSVERRSDRALERPGLYTRYMCYAYTRRQGLNRKAIHSEQNGILHKLHPFQGHFQWSHSRHDRLQVACSLGGGPCRSFKKRSSCYCRVRSLGSRFHYQLAFKSDEDRMTHCGWETFRVKGRRSEGNWKSVRSGPRKENRCP